MRRVCYYHLSPRCVGLILLPNARHIHVYCFSMAQMEVSIHFMRSRCPCIHHVERGEAKGEVVQQRKNHTQIPSFSIEKGKRFFLCSNRSNPSGSPSSSLSCTLSLSLSFRYLLLFPSPLNVLFYMCRSPFPLPLRLLSLSSFICDIYSHIFFIIHLFYFVFV